MTGTTYRAWLRSLGVRYVLLTDAPTDYSSKQEALLIHNGRSGLIPVHNTRHITIFEVPNAAADRDRTGPGAGCSGSDRRRW